MLFAIKAHVAAHPHITLSALAQHFDVPPSAMQAMVGQWVRKGIIIASNDQGCGSGGCGGCPQQCAVVRYHCA